MLVSIILPIYNMEKYLDRCMESIFAQTYKDLEIIMVDDGSKDSTPTMCDQYGEQDSRIIVLHKANGGLSSARNAGMEVATGEYLFFVDPDDKLPTDAVEKMMKVAQMHPYDVIKALHYVVKEDEKRLTNYVWSEGKVSRNGTPEERERWRLMKTSWTFGCAWAGIYRRQFLVERELVFDDNRKIFLEDVLFNSKLFSYEPEYYMLCEPVYEYYYVEGSLLNRYTPDLSLKLRSLLREYSSFLKNNDAYSQNMDLVVTLTARYFCWITSETAKEKNGAYSAIKETIVEFAMDQSVQDVLRQKDSLKQLHHLARWSDTMFYSLCMGLLKSKCYSLLTIMYMLINPVMKIYSQRRTRV